MAAAFVAVYGRGPGSQVADVVGAIMDRMEEGHALDGIAHDLIRFGDHAPKGTPIAELKRILES